MDELIFVLWWGDYFVCVKNFMLQAQEAVILISDAKVLKILYDGMIIEGNTKRKH